MIIMMCFDSVFFGEIAGGRLVAHYHKKKAGSAVCGQLNCSIKLSGIKAARPRAKKRLKPRDRTVSRAYGGVLCMDCTRQKFVTISISSQYLIGLFLGSQSNI